MSNMITDEECTICYEEFSQHDLESGFLCDSDPKERLKVNGCTHTFCRNCLTNHCKHAISSREIPICCPASASEGCENILSESQVKSILQANADILDSSSKKYGPIHKKDALACDVGAAESLDWLRFQRLQRMLQDSSLVACTRCEEVLSKELNRTKYGHANDLTCPRCAHEFCAVHGDAHISKSCREYRPARQDRKSLRAIRKSTKPCSHCAIPIYKESGCDHIVCVHCKKDMCFKCGSHLHLSGGMIRTCSKCNQNYVDHRYVWRYRLALCLSLPLYIPFCIVYIFVVGIFASATCACFCCLCCGAQFELEEPNEGSSSSENGNLRFRPCEATKNVLGIVFLPVLDLLRQCGMPWCCGLEVPGLEETDTASESFELDERSIDDK